MGRGETRKEEGKKDGEDMRLDNKGRYEKQQGLEREERREEQTRKEEGNNRE